MKRDLLKNLKLFDELGREMYKEIKETKQCILYLSSWTEYLHRRNQFQINYFFYKWILIVIFSLSKQFAKWVTTRNNCSKVCKPKRKFSALTILMNEKKTQNAKRRQTFTKISRTAFIWHWKAQIYGIYYLDQLTPEEDQWVQWPKCCDNKNKD